MAFIDSVSVKYRRHSGQLTHHSNILKIFNAVDEIIQPYEKEFIEAGKHRLFLRRRSEILENVGKVLLSDFRTREARGNLFRAARMDPSRLAVYPHLVLSLLPRPVLEMIFRKTGK